MTTNTTNSLNVTEYEYTYKTSYTIVYNNDGTINREFYENDLKRRQENHLKRINNNIKWTPCMHDNCPECIGTGFKSNGSICIHMIACNCHKCSPTY